jgi:hypothetical protein
MLLATPSEHPNAVQLKRNAVGGEGRLAGKGGCQTSLFVQSFYGI